MAVAQPNVIEEEDLTDADREILDVLSEKPLTKGAIVDKTGLHRNTVGNRLDALNYGDAIDCIHDRTALYELVDDPRNESASQPAEDDPTIEALQARIEDLESDLTQAREEINALRDERDTLQAQLNGAIHPEDVHAVVLELRGALEQGDRTDIDVALSRLTTIAGDVG